jgi:hypothetical protein
MRLAAVEEVTLGEASAAYQQIKGTLLDRVNHLEQVVRDSLKQKKVGHGDCMEESRRSSSEFHECLDADEGRARRDKSHIEAEIKVVAQASARSKRIDHKSLTTQIAKLTKELDARNTALATAEERFKKREHTLEHQLANLSAQLQTGAKHSETKLEQLSAKYQQVVAILE